jgi:hypothetical protein
MSAELLKLAADTLRNLAKENEDLKSRLSIYTRKDEAIKVARDLSKRGLLNSEDILSTSEEWVTNDKDLNIVKEAADMVGSSPDPSNWAGTEAGGKHFKDPGHAFDDWVMNG